MKSLAMPALYVFSIVLAVGIGMGQVGKGGATVGADIPNCGVRVVSPSCGTLGIGPEGNPCGNDFANVVQQEGQRQTYRASSDSSKPNQCVFDDRVCPQTFPHLLVDWRECNRVD